jgi:hypothetical protein
MGINFPAAPIIGELYPTPAIAGIPQYKWDGTVWLATTPSALTYVQRGGDTMTGHLALPVSPAAANAVRRDFVEAYAAPFDAMAYSGMQVNGGVTVGQELGADNPLALPNNNTAYFADGWVGVSAGTQRVSGRLTTSIAPPGFVACAQVYVTTLSASIGATDYCVIQHPIEGYRIQRLSWGKANAVPITIAFWVYASRAGTYSGAINNKPINRSYTFNISVNAASTWEYKVVTIPGDTTGTWAAGNGVGLSILFTLATGSSFQTAAGVWTAGNFMGVPGTINGVASGSDTLCVSGLVVLPGSQAPTAAQSPLIMRPYDQELVTCQRYFQWLPFAANYHCYTAGDNMWVPVAFPTAMRSRPTMSTLAIDPGAADNYNTGTIIQADWISVSPASATIRVISNTLAMVYISGYRGSADARL